MKLSSDSVNVYERKKVKLQNNKKKKKRTFALIQFISAQSCIWYK